MGPDSARLIADALRGRRNHSDGTWVFNSSLRSLNLEFNSIGDEGIVAIAQARDERPSVHSQISQTPHVLFLFFYLAASQTPPPAAGRRPRSFDDVSRRLSPHPTSEL